MAPRRGADSLLARLACAASARTVILALAVASLLLFVGCGGDDDSSDAAATQATSGAAAEGGSGAGDGPGSDSQSEDSQGENPGGQGGGGDGLPDGSNVPAPEGEPAPEITPEQRRKVTKANVTLESPAFKGGTTLPAKFTCDGKNTWPALRWEGLPPEAEELVLMILSVHPTEQKLLFDWAVAGLDPSLEGIAEGKLPAGAIVGENSFGERGYSLCPPKGQAENYIFMLFAIPEALDPSPGFDARSLREEVLAQAGNVGLLNATYKRK